MKNKYTSAPLSQKRYLKVVFYLMICFFLVQLGCNSQQEKNVIKFGKFPETFELSGEKVLKLNQLAPNNIFGVDSLYLVYEYNGGENFFYVYNNDFKQIGSFGKKGKGPGEFLYLRYAGQYEMGTDGRIKLWVYDGNTFKGYKIDLARACEAKDESFIEMTIDLPSEVLTIPEIFFLNNGQKVFGRSDMYSNGRYFVFYPKEGIIDWLAAVPEVEDFTVPENIKLAYHAVSCLDNSGNRLYSGMTFFPRIDVYDTSGSIRKTMIYDSGKSNPDFTSKDNPFHPDNYEYFFDVQADEHFIYALYQGIKHGDMVKSYDGMMTLNSHLFVFDLEGNPRYDLILPGTYYNFCLDKGSQHIITIDYSGDEPTLKIWKIPFIS